MFEKKKSAAFNSMEAIDRVVKNAIDLRASDIHFEPFEEVFRVRFRIDGVLMKYCALPLEKRDELTAIIKIMASLDSIAKREPQDGKITMEHGGAAVEIRVSTMPVKYGEKIVLRILQGNQLDFKIDNLGVNRECLPILKNTLSARQGLVLITGSTGSGKTTTIYSALDFIKSDELNIVTVEDPIEYEVPGLIQIQISREVQMSYIDILKAVMRQDPDVLVIGEIRDPETARVAIQASLTGHLVIASLHTNDSIDTIVRLTEMGIKSYLLAAALRLIIAQRLVRLLCPHCKQETSPSPEHAAIFSLSPDMVVHTPKGCPHCSGTGYHGRKPAFEFLVIDDAVIEILAKNNKSYELKNKLKKRRTSILFDEARKAIIAGSTSCEEVMKKIVY